MNQSNRALRELEKILDDAFEMGVNHGKGLWNDYPNLKAGMVKKARQSVTNHIKERLPEKFGVEHTETTEEYIGKEWFNQAITEFETILEEVSNADQ